MTRLICEPHLACCDCGYWLFICRYAARRGWGRIGVCACPDSEHHGHTLDQTHQACGHRKATEKEPRNTRTTRKKKQVCHRGHRGHRGDRDETVI
jgi:hypothetical protein